MFATSATFQPRSLPNLFGDHVPNIEIFRRLRPAALNCRKFSQNLDMSRQVREVAETKISADQSRITQPAELYEIIQYRTLNRKSNMSLSSFFPQDTNLTANL